MEIDTMLSESVRNIFDEYRQQREQRAQEFDKQMALSEKRMNTRIDAEIAEVRSRYRWLMGIIITCTLALAGYTSVLILIH